MVGARPRLAEEPDARGRPGRGERLPVGYDDPVLLRLADVQPLLAGRPRRGAQRRAQPLEQLEVVLDVRGVVEHALILAGR